NALGKWLILLPTCQAQFSVVTIQFSIFNAGQHPREAGVWKAQVVQPQMGVRVGVLESYAPYGAVLLPYINPGLTELLLKGRKGSRLLASQQGGWTSDQENAAKRALKARTGWFSERGGRKTTPSASALVASR